MPTLVIDTATAACSVALIERGEVANSWRRERWDSFRLLTPNWQSRLPGLAYEGPDPDGYMTTKEVTQLIERFAALSGSPVRTGTAVTSTPIRSIETRPAKGQRCPATIAAPPVPSAAPSARLAVRG